MDMHLEETPTASKLSDAKASIYETFNELRKWRENQLQRFREKQLMDHHSLSQESGKKLENFLENNKDVLFKGQDCSSNSNLTASESTFNDQDSSISGHILRCFSDASHDDSAVFQRKFPEDAITSKRHGNGGYSSINIKPIPESSEESLDNPIDLPAPKKPKPFLRKRSGLVRYAPKQKADFVYAPQQTAAKSSANQQYTTDYPPQLKLQLKPAIVKSSSPPRKVNRVQFKEPVLVSQLDAPRPFAADSPDNSSVENINVDQENTDLVDDNMSKETASSEDLLAEKRELDEFEILENCAQNSSFNSDSSVVQKVLLGQPLQRSQQNSEVTLSSCSSGTNYESGKKIQSELPVFSSKVDNYAEDIPSRKKHLQNYISNIDTKIASLQREVSNSNKYNYVSSEVDSDNFCSTPVKNQKNGKIVPEDSDCDTPQNSPSNSIMCIENKFADLNVRPSLKNADSNTLKESKISTFSTDEKESAFDEDVCALPVDDLKSKLREKMQMLEKEIQSFQKENAQLAAFAKERDEVLKKLKKEQEEFQKYKDQEKKKLQTEIENERQQLKRQKETFNRFQKLRSDNPGRKEREEITTLRQEAQKLQEELKKQRIRFNKDTRRLKDQLMAAENERDGLKLDNIALEDQVQDLLAILKGRSSVKKKLGVPSKTTQTEKHSKTSNSSKEPIANQDVNQLENSSLSLKGISSSEKNSNSSNTKQKVRFNLVPEYNSNRDKIIEAEMLNGINTDGASDSAVQLNNDVVVESCSEESENEEPLYEEFNHGDKVERVYLSGEKEIIFTSGTLKHISADGKTIKISYHNGDVKEIFPDKREVYTYVSGVIEKHFPDGLEVTMFPGGQVQKIHPDGLKEVKFPDGTVHFIHCNGSQEILAKDGIMVRLDPDGTETVEFPNGEREIRKDDYKRREYPDGSVKTVYDSGRQETRYSNGRIRIKDKSGKLLVDTKHLKGLAGKFS